jgi:CSLREA domain-containing protein
MHGHRHRVTGGVWWAALLAVMVAVALGSVDGGGPAEAAAFSVTAADDADDGVCDATHCSLREAINAANAAAGADTITFAFAGPTTIPPAAPLPAITDSLTVDGAVPGGRVELDGVTAGGAGLSLTAGTSTLKNMVIGRFGSGISVTGGTATIEGNYIGTDAAGGAARGNGSGIYVNTAGAVIGGSSAAARNVISGNSIGISLETAATPITINGNFIGTNAAGTAALANGLGVLVRGVNVTIGGPSAGDRNIISGNTTSGIRVTAFGGTRLFRGNYIGLDASGTYAVPNGQYGIESDWGGSIQVVGNVISGNGSWAMYAARETGGSVKGNLIGTDASGMRAVPNGAGGIVVVGFAVGGTNPTDANTIAGNIGDGIAGGGITAVDGNRIGVAVDGVTPLGNSGVGVGMYGGGIAVYPGANTIGTVAQNIIAYNGSAGIVAADTSRPTTVGPNSIYDNGGLGVDVNLPSPVPAPVITMATVNGFGLFEVRWTGYASSTDLYTSPSCDPSGSGEGKTYIGSISGGRFLGSPQDVAHPWFITAITRNSTGATSEFSNCFPGCYGTADTECDSFADTPAANSCPSQPWICPLGPANAYGAEDNCPGVYNPDQLNFDANYTDLPPSGIGSTDDRTLVNSDNIGDACDSDDDNDGIDDAVESALPFFCASASNVTNPKALDTDYDLFTDGAECALGTDPTNSASRPALAACGAAADTDGDGISNQNEFCNYGSNPNSTNSDGDGCGDRREVASVNSDQNVTAADLGLVASSFGAYVPGPGTVDNIDFDPNKDGNITASDLGRVAAAFGACP